MAAARAYLDYNASAPLITEAREAMVAALDLAANPSSVHAEGRAARRLIENARRDVAALVNAKPEHVVFTSGATEAASTLLTPDWQMGRGAVRMSRLYVCEADHPCLLNGGRFPAAQVTRIGVDANGIADLAQLTAALAAHDKADGLPLVAIHAANNETGVIQPIEAIAAIVKAAGGILVVDAVQAAGRISIDMSAAYADYLILSSHKIGGPKGVGAIVAAADLMMPKPLINGGGQEKGHRGGTENLAAIAGFGAAARQALAGLQAMDAIAHRRDEVETDHQNPGAGRRNLRNRRAKACQYDILRYSRRQGRDGADRFRSGRRCAVGGIGLFVGQGRSEPCAESHGLWRQPRRFARVHRPRDERWGYRTVPYCAGGDCPAPGGQGTSRLRRRQRIQALWPGRAVRLQVAG